ncbi:hypothetical protein M728_002160 [Ensifer sp. WSM1721]
MTELRAVLSTRNEISMHAEFKVGRDFIICRTAKDSSGKWAMAPFAHIVQLLHVSLNRTRFKDKNMQQFKVLQRPLCV